MSNSIKIVLAMSLLLLLITYDRTISYWNKPEIQAPKSAGRQSFTRKNYSQGVTVIGMGAERTMHRAGDMIIINGDSLRIIGVDSINVSKK